MTWNMGVININNFLFANENIFTFNSGVEISAINRLKLFKSNGLNALIITRNFDPFLSRNIAKYNLDHNDIVNMYDYFQGFTNIPKHHEYLRYSKFIDKNHYKIVGINNDISNIEKMGKLVAKVHILPETFGEIGEIDYYDDFMDICRKDIYDCRGVRTKIKYFNPDGNVSHEYFLDVFGKPVIELTHMNVNGILKTTLIELLDYNGKNYRFNSENELFSFFINEISNSKTIIVNDRPSLISPIDNTSNEILKYQFIHSNHIDNSSNEIFTNLDYIFKENSFSGIIVSTNKQKHDIQKKFKHLNVYAISDYAIFKSENNIDKKLDNNITYIGRIFKDKNIEDIIYVISYVKKYIENVHLNLVGYFESEDYKKHLVNLINNLNLSNNVTFTGYKFYKAKSNILRKTKIIIQTSLSESLGISLLEGLSYGIPDIAYNVKYGPKETINNNKSGYLIPLGKKQLMSKKIVKLLSNNNLYYKFSNNALLMSDKFKSDVVIEEWKQIID